MRVVILTDSQFARREQALLSRLEIGLADEGVRVIHALPATASDPAPSTAADLFAPRAESSAHRDHAPSSEAVSLGGTGALYCTSVSYEDVGFAFSIPARARRLARAISTALDEPETLSLDLVHVFGQHAWGMAAELARITRARVAYEVWSAALLPGVARAALPRAPVTGGLPGAAPAFLTPGRLLAEALSKQAPLAGVHVTPWGVPVSEAPRPPPADPSAALAACVFATGAEPYSVLAALEALRDVAAALPQLLVFLDSHAAGRPQIWRRVRRLGLMERLSVVADIESRREPILRTSVLVQPEALGEHHSLTLAAMSAGMPVVARADPMVDSLIDGQTARLVSRPTPAAWAEALHQVLADQAFAHRLGLSARQHVHHHHSVSGYAAAVLTAYETLVTPPARVTA